MSTIDEIMGAVGCHGDDCIRDADAASESFEALREMIAAALADARREGAEQMRAESAKLARALPLYYGSGDDGADESLAQAIEDLPLPAGPRQASRGYEVGAGTDAARRTEMITREQLELAALAAGIAGFVETNDRTQCQSLWINSDVGGGFYWDPHKCIGTAARLAVRLNMSVDIDGATAFAHIDGYEELDDSGYGTEEHDGTEPDKLRAWREAVTLCAAAVGERMRGER